MKNEIPPAILAAIREGRAILFLGAAASYDAILSGKPTKITADEVKSRLSVEFLGGKYKERSLQTVADFARNEASLRDVQKLIHSMFVDLVPNAFHLLVPKFRWKAIVTTNYDLIVERAYQSVESPLQDIFPVTRDGEGLENALGAQNSVPYLKLHGCINAHTDIQVPIVLDSQEYSKFSQGRANLVSTFKEWAINHPILFCGYSLNDENIKQILFDVGDASQARPQYLYVVPGMEQIEARYWSARRMAPLADTYQNFLELIDSSITSESRQLAAAFHVGAISISKWIPSHLTPSPSLVQYLSEEVMHILPSAGSAKKSDPASFYSGLEIGFSPIYDDLDVRRQVIDDLLERVVLNTLLSTLPKFFVLRGYAGCGKSVIGRRLAIETAGIIDTPLVIYIPSGAIIRPELLLELQSLVQSRLYVFVDDMLEHNDTLPHFLDTITNKSTCITVFATARTNELSVYGKDYSGKISGDFEIGDLEGVEVEALLVKLSANKLLGPLQEYDEADRRTFLEKFYGRQLLVALHEITRGDSFSAIIVDEFEKIIPRQAQQMYLDICTLHQCGVSVRSGLLSRLSGMQISDLNVYLAGALSKVVIATYDHKVRDYVYRSRHEEISKIVFDLAIPNAEQRMLQLQRILAFMDLNYSSDKKAFFDLLKGRKLAEMFESKGAAIAIFDSAEQSHPPKSYISHQRAILELNHKNGSLELANEFLRRAEIEVKEEGYGDASIRHTKANLLRKRALVATNLVEKERYRADARAILKPQLFKRKSAHSETLFGQLLLDEIKTTIATEHALSDATVSTVNELSALIDDSLRAEPNDEQLTLLKVDFLKTLGKSPTALKLLDEYCKRNPNAISVTRVYAESLVRNGKINEAEQILRKFVVNTPSDKSLNLAFAKVLIELDEGAHEEAILMHLRRSFSDGDTNYDARFYFARCNLLYGDVDRGKREFDALRIPYIKYREKVRDVVKSADAGNRRFSGKILSKQAGYGFVQSTELRFNAFLSKSNTSKELWDDLHKGSLVRFSLGFNFMGPIVIETEGHQLALPLNSMENQRNSQDESIE